MGAHTPDLCVLELWFALGVFVFIDAVLGVEPRVLCVLGQHSTNLASFSACPGVLRVRDFVLSVYGTWLCLVESERLVLTRDIILSLSTSLAKGQRRGWDQAFVQ